MTKKEIVKTISEECGLTQLKTKEIVQRTFEAIIDTLVAEGRIELRNFGVFEVKKRAARKARNPRSGDRVDVPEKFVVTFKPGKEMEERVLNFEKESATTAQSATAAPTIPQQQSPPVPPTLTPESQSQTQTAAQTPPVGSPTPSVPPTPDTPPPTFPPSGGQP